MSKHILIVAGMSPVPCNTGSRLRLYHAIEQMLLRGFSVSAALVTNECNAETRNLVEAHFHARGIKHQIITLPGQHGLLSLLDRIRQGLFGSALPLNATTSSIIMKMIDELRPDIVHLHKTVSSSFVDIDLLRSRDILVSLDEGGGVHYLAYAQEAEQATFPSSLIWQRRTRRFFRYETALLKHIDVVTSCCPSEMDLIRPRLGPATTLLFSPNGFDEAILKTAPPLYRSREDALFFCGRFSYKPNADAVVFYLKEILPRLETPVPTLFVAGDQCPAELQAPLNNHPHIKLLGYVDDIHAMFRKYRIMLNPVRLGGGTNLKLLEAMANGMACISTKMSADGICAEDGKHLLKADTATDIANAINRLRKDTDLGERLSTDGRAFVANRYTWPACFAPLMDYYQSRQDADTGRAPV